jgi:agmatine/peptidylarginine deiminase
MLGLNELLSHSPQLTCDIVGALAGHIPLICIVVSEEQRRQAVTLLSDWGLPAHLLHFVFMPVRSMWVRDYGPVFVRWSDGSVTILDAHYAAPDRPNDDLVPSAVAALLKVPVAQVPLNVDGGNILSNGQGLCLTTSLMIHRNQMRGYDQRRVTQILSEYYGFYSGLFLAPLQGEHTGHVDIFATFTAPDTLVIGQYDKSVDPVNAELLDRNAAAVAQLQTRRGRMRVVRIPMPSHADGIWRTYTNVIYANDRVLVPSYPSQDQELEQRAMAIFRELLPDRRIIPIDCEPLIGQHGALRCVSINIPWLTDRFALPERQYAPQVTALSA